MSLHTLMFGWEYPPQSEGGLGVACHGLVNGLLQNGMRVTLVLPMGVEVQAAGLRTINASHGSSCDVQVIPSLLQPYDTAESYEQRVAHIGEGHAMSGLYGPDLGAAVENYSARSVELTRTVSADVVHSHDWMTYEAGIRASRHQRIPFVAHIHATELDRTDFHPNPWIAEKERSGLLRADKVIAVSNYTKNLLVNQYGIPADKIAVVHNGHMQTTPVAQSPARSQKRGPLVLFLGRLTTQKNPWNFLDVCKLVHDMRPDAQFVIAGDGPMLQKLIDRTCELGLTDCITFTGKVARGDVDNLYRNASCFVMPSLSEPFGLVALEAIAHGTPVVMSKQSGAAEVVDHAFKVDFWDTDRFADCIVTVLREEPLARQLTSHAPRVLQKLTWGNQAHAVQSVYHNLLRI